MMRSNLSRFAVLSVLLTAAACQETTAPEAVDDTLLADVALVAADAVIADVKLMTQPFGFGVAGAPERGSGNAAPGRPGGQRGIGRRFSGTREVSFFDAAGNEQDAYDPLTTATIHFTMEVSGEVSRGTWTASVERSRDMTITGLEGEETTRTFNGTGEETVSRSRHLDDGTEHTYDMEGTVTRTDVVVPVPGSDSPYPLSGTIHRTMTVTVVGGPNGDFTREVDVTITFDGDSTATAVVNGETFEIDLSARQGKNPVRGRRGRGG